MDTNKLNELLKSRGLTFTWLSKEMNMTRQTLTNRVKSNKLTPSEIVKLTNALRFSYAEFNDFLFDGQLSFYAKKSVS